MKDLQLKSLFDTFATGVLDSKKMMTRQDFMRALQADSGLELPPSYEILFSVADTKQRNLLSLQDFVALHDLLNKPNAEYLVAFRLFDVRSRGKVSRDEFIQVWKSHVPEGHFTFDVEKSDTLRLYFGLNKDRKVGFEEFSQLLKGLQEGRLRQEFHRYDTEGTGFVSADEFAKIVKSVVQHKMSTYVEHHLASIGNLYPFGGQRVSWATVAAFNNVVRQIDLVRLIAAIAAKDRPEIVITKADFLNAAYRYTRFSLFTPMEVDIIFHFASLNSQNPSTITLKNLDDMMTRHSKKEMKLVKKEDSSIKLPVWVEGVRQLYNFALGSVAGAIGASVVYPIDLVKTRMQNQRSAVVGEVMYKNSFDCFKKVISKEGFLGLYSGLGPQLVGVAPEKAIKLTVNDLVRALLTNKDTGEIPVYGEILAGCTAGGSQVIFTNPLEIVKIRLQVQGETTGARKSAMDIVKQLGLLGLYKGAGACLLRDIPFSGIYFTSYSHIKKEIFAENLSEGKRLTMGELLIAGAMAGMPAAYLTTPADVIKTRLQVEQKTGHAGYKNIRDATRRILKEEGVSAFFKGGPARIFRSSPQFGVTLMTYELFKQWIPFPWDKPLPQRKDNQVIQPPVKDVGILKIRNALQLLRDIDYQFGNYSVPVAQK